MKRSKNKIWGDSHSEMWSPGRNYKIIVIEACWLINKNTAVEQTKYDIGDISARAPCMTG